MRVMNTSSHDRFRLCRHVVSSDAVISKTVKMLMYFTFSYEVVVVVYLFWCEMLNLRLWRKIDCLISDDGIRSIWDVVINDISFSEKWLLLHWMWMNWMSIFVWIYVFVGFKVNSCNWLPYYSFCSSSTHEISAPTIPCKMLSHTFIPSLHPSTSNQLQIIENRWKQSLFKSDLSNKNNIEERFKVLE